VSRPSQGFRRTAAIRALIAFLSGAAPLRAFDVSGYSFTDLNFSNSPAANSNRYSGNFRSRPPPGPPPGPTPEELERMSERQRELQIERNRAGFQRALAAIKPAPVETGNGSMPVSDMCALMAYGLFEAVGRPLLEILAASTPPDQPRNLHIPPFTGHPETPPFDPAAQLILIGGIGAIRGDIEITSPNGQTRKGAPGMPVYLNDHVHTRSNARLQVVLADETVFTMGPDSDMVLDEFVYDPNTSVGKITARWTKGVFRFVSGKVARESPSNMKVIGPTSTIGIRGTDFQVALDPASGDGFAKLYYGKLEVTENNSGETIALDSGQMVTYNQAGDTRGPEPLDADPTGSKIEAAGRALYLLRAAARLADGGDREFLAQQAGFAMQGGAVPLEFPDGAGSRTEDAINLYSLEQSLECKQAEFAHFRRQRQWIEEANGDATAVAQREDEAKAALAEAWEARQALIENRAVRTWKDELQ
jgi:hypothetical protein